jgi:predicted AlkP superfamily pyrophosphatase or phosphodiesterase
VPAGYRRVLLVIIDGLRPDAVTAAGMPTLDRLMTLGWRAGAATTVRPSVTVAALTSLATGVSPARHGIDHPSLTRLGRIRGLAPLPVELRRHGVETTILAPTLGGATRWMAGALLRLGGVSRLGGGTGAPGLLLEQAALHLAAASGPAFVVAYVNDTDLAGHAWGWMSAPYLQAAAIIDRGLRHLEPLLEDPETLVIVTADHGGGGVLPNDHDHPHPINDRIPLVLLGTGVQRTDAPAGSAHLLDIPPTVLWSLGAAIPAQYEGRVLSEAFAPAEVLA